MSVGIVVAEGFFRLRDRLRDLDFSEEEEEADEVLKGKVVRVIERGGASVFENSRKRDGKHGEIARTSQTRWLFGSYCTTAR